MRRLLHLLLLLLLLSACAAPRATDHEQVSQGERIVMKFSHVVAENTPKGLAARRFAQLVKERTLGRVEIQVFPNSQLFRDGEELDALRAGKVQFIAPSISKLGEIDPLWQVFDLPYLFSDEAAVRRVISGATGQRLYGNLRRQAVEPLAFWENGFKVVTNARGPLVEPQDAEGLRFRIQPSVVTRDAFTSLGAEVSVQSFDSLYGVLSKGGLDAQENTPSNIYSKRIHEVQPYLTVTNHGYLGYVVLTNLKTWTALPPDIRETVREALIDATQWVHENAPIINQQAMESIRLSGKVEIREQTPEERERWKLSMQPAYVRAEERLGAEAMRTVLSEAQDR